LIGQKIQMVLVQEVEDPSKPIKIVMMRPTLWEQAAAESRARGCAVGGGLLVED
jgi:hypothetical protein